MRTVGGEEDGPQPTPSPRIAVCGGLPLVRMLNNFFVSPVDRLIFPCPRPSYDDATYPWSASDLIWLRDPYSGHQFPVVVIEPLDGTPPVRVIIYCHGNACDIGEVYLNLKQEAARWRALLVIVEYPGYGLSPGAPHAEGVDRHVRAAYDHFTVTLGVRPERVVLFGASVGTGPAARLAADVQAAGGRVGGLILQSPYTCVRDAAASLVGGLAYVIFERWDNRAALSTLACPLLIIHGTKDDVIPFAHGAALRDLREQARLPVVFHAQEGATHNTYRAKEDLSVPVAAFLVKVHAQGSALVIRPNAGGAGDASPQAADGQAPAQASLPRVWGR